MLKSFKLGTTPNFIIVIILLLSTIGLSYTIPKGKKYVGTDFISHLELPHSFTDWQGKDVSDQLNINLGNDLYKFLNEYLSFQYHSKDGRNIIITFIDAGNFHYPNTCFEAAGFSFKELDQTELHASGRTFKVYTIYSEKPRKNEKSLTLYWIVIDKKLVPNWVEQKMKQLYFSLFNQKRVGLMIRLDIPIKYGTISNTSVLAKQFIRDFSTNLSSDQADYIFGEIN